MSNQLGTVQLYLAWLSILAENSSAISVVDVTRPPPEVSKLATELPPGYAAFPDIGVAYKFYRLEKTWYDARKYCIGDGGNLAVIDSFEKIKYVMDLKGTTNPPDIHIGIHRFFNDEWVEVQSGSSPTIIPWRADPFIHERHRKCAVIDYPGRGVVASLCSDASFNFVCEISLFKK